MASKKYLLLAGFVTLLTAFESKAQVNGSTDETTFDYTDSTLVKSKRMEQYREFVSGENKLPARPRSQWEIGLNVGGLNVSGDVRTKTIFNGPIKPFNTLGWGFTIRKSLGYVFSTRLQFHHGRASGYNWERGYSYIGHGQNQWEKAYNATGQTKIGVAENYMTKLNELTLQLVGNFNNIRFLRATKNKFGVYAFLGAGLMTYETKVDVYGADGKVHDWSTIDAGIPTGGSGEYRNRQKINKNLRNLLDGDYETDAEGHHNRGTFMNGTVRPVGVFGAGMLIKLSKKLSLQIEDKASLTMDDLIDAKRWQEPSQDLSTGAFVTSAMTRDFDNVNYLSVGLNLNLGKASTLPLTWLNPMEYAYGQKATKAVESKCDKDSDGDGISDCFDRCPNTPGGVSVDSHGCPFDTDGDGVADYKDKQLITPTECQPVDADGVGKCPDPACCSTPHQVVGCSAVPSGSVDFASGSAKLSSGSMAQLNTLATSMRANPNCKVVVVGNGNGSKVAQQRSWDRVNSVINYMVDKQGIDRERFIFQYGVEGNENAVNYRSAGAGEEGPSNTPPPFPNLRRN